MEQIGEIVEIRDKRVLVRIQKASACGENCANCEGGCKPTSRMINAINSANAQVGDMVKLEMNSGIFMFLAFIGYILPILLSIGAYFIADSITDNTVISDAVLVLTLILTLVIFYFIDKLPSKPTRFSTRVVKVIK